MTIIGWIGLALLVGVGLPLAIYLLFRSGNEDINNF